MSDGGISEEEVCEGHDEEHVVDPELLELYEVLEFTGQISPNFPKGSEARSAQLLAASPPGTIISRASWGARAPEGTTRLYDPDGSTAHYEGPQMGSFPHTSCATKVRGIQAYHMDQKGWADIAYSSIVCPHGCIFVCRWWNHRTAANGTNAGNAAHYAHCVLIGQGDPFTDEAKQALSIVFNLARLDGGAGPEQKVHSDWKATACPGDPVRAFVRAGLPVGPPPVTVEPISFVGTLEEETVRAKVEVPTDVVGNGWRDTGIPWDQYRGVSTIGFDPPYVGAYKNPVVTAHEINGQVRVVLTNWIPNNKGVVYVNHATN